MFVTFEIATDTVLNAVQLPVVGTVTMRLEDVTALQAVTIIVKAKGLFLDKIDNVYYIKTAAERTAEPTESDSYQFSYSRAKETAPLISAQLSSKDPQAPGPDRQADEAGHDRGAFGRSNGQSTASLRD